VSFDEPDKDFYIDVSYVVKVFTGSGLRSAKVLRYALTIGAIVISGARNKCFIDAFMKDNVEQQLLPF